MPAGCNTPARRCCRRRCPAAASLLAAGLSLACLAGCCLMHPTPLSPAVAITVGPACQKVEQLVALLEAGVTCARIDLTVRLWPGRTARSSSTCDAVAEFELPLERQWAQAQPLRRSMSSSRCCRSRLLRAHSASPLLTCQSAASLWPICAGAHTHTSMLPGPPQWAPIEYHRTSLLNLQEAMRRTKRLCAVMLDCLGRELMIKRK